MRCIILISLLLTSSVVASVEYTRPSEIPISAYAQLPSMSGVSISPDGSHIAYLQPKDRVVYLVIERLWPDPNRVLVPPTENLKFDWVRWANDERIVFAMSFFDRRGVTELTETRLLSVDKSGDNLRAIIKPGKRTETGTRVAKDLAPPQLQDDVIDWLVDDPEHILVSIDEDRDGRDEVRKVNVVTGEYRIVQGGMPGIQNWITDHAGVPRIGYGYKLSDVRAPDNPTAVFVDSDGEWATVTNSGWYSKGYVPIAATDNPHRFYMIGPDESGKRIVRVVDVKEDQLLDIVFAHEKVDIGGYTNNSSNNRLLGVTYTADSPKTSYIDKSMDVLQRSVDKILPERSNSLESWTHDWRQIIVLSTSDTVPGEYYYWDRDTKSFDFLADVMPQLPIDLLSVVEPVTYKTRDDVEIPAYLTVPQGQEAMNLPTIILPHGGPSRRDAKVFNFLPQFLASRGYAVFQPNFRGSSGYGKSFLEAGYRQWGGIMQQDVVDGTRWLIDEGIADPDRICIVGMSYGGYSAAMGLIQSPGLFRCAASINGVMNLVRHMEDDRQYIGGKARLQRVGLEGSDAAAVSPSHLADRVRAPMLIVQAQDDARVHVDQGRGMYERLSKLGRPVVYKEVEFGGHDLHDGAARLAMLQALEEFLLDTIGEGAR